MTPQEFKIAWNNIEMPLSPLTPARLIGLNLSQSTVDFLTIAGLPTCTESNLYFCNDTEDDLDCIKKLVDQYDFEEEREKFEKYIVIGSCRDGDPIAIDTKSNDMIFELDHEDSFTPIFFNSSINSLASFLIIYQDFEKSVLLGKDLDDDFQVFNFSNDQFDDLKRKMLQEDERAIAEGFWKEELDIMLSIRQQKFNKT